MLLLRCLHSMFQLIFRRADWILKVYFSYTHTIEYKPHCSHSLFIKLMFFQFIKSGDDSENLFVYRWYFVQWRMLSGYAHYQDLELEVWKCQKAECTRVCVMARWGRGQAGCGILLISVTGSCWLCCSCGNTPEKAVDWSCPHLVPPAPPPATQYNIDHNILITQRETLASDHGIDKS